MGKFGLLIGAVGLVLCSSGNIAKAEKPFVYGQWLPPKHNVNIWGLKPLVKDLAAKGIHWKLVTGGQLFKAKGTLKGVGNRTAEAGLVVPSYHRTQLKHAFIVSDLLMIGRNELIMNGAAHETMMLQCPECMGDYAKQKLIYLAGYGVGGYSMLCRKMVTNASDIKGLKIRTTGALGRWARKLGGVPVSMSMSDTPEAIKRGNIDCIAGPVAWLKSYPISDSIKSILNYGLGSYSGLGLFVMNRKAWDSYTDDQKRIMWDAMPGTIARTVIDGYVGDDIISRQLAKKEGITITKTGAAMEAIWKEHKKGEVALAVKNATKMKAKNAQRIADTFVTNVKKWEKIIADAGLENAIANATPDRASLAKASKIYKGLMIKHIYSKIDPTKL